MTAEKGNLFEPPPPGLNGEVFATLLCREGVRIERIVSTGQASPQGFWYDQPRHEFVVLLSGSATLRFEHDEGLVHLRPGDWLDIAAHRRHRVEWTQANPPTVWLAVHFGGAQTEDG